MNRKGNRQHSPTPPKQKWQNIYLALCVLLGMLASCETEESFYQPRFPANNIPLTRQALFKPENFFAYTDSTLKAFHRSFPVEIRHSSLELHLPIDRRRRDLHLRSPLPP